MNTIPPTPPPQPKPMDKDRYAAIQAKAHARLATKRQALSEGEMVKFDSVEQLFEAARKGE